MDSSRKASRRDVLKLGAAGTAAAGLASVGLGRRGAEGAVLASADQPAAAGSAGVAAADTAAASRVTEFLASIGVNAHIGQGVDSAPQIATALSYLGIANLRDDANTAYVDAWIALYQQSGSRINLLTNDNVPATMAMAEELQAAGALMAIEGPNEPNNQPVTYDGVTSTSSANFVPVAEFQAALYQAVEQARHRNSEPSLAGIPVFASSEAGGSEPDNVGLQFLTIPASADTLMPAGTVYGDYANTHTYPQGHVGTWRDNMAWNGADPTLNGDWDGLWVEYGTTWNKGFPGYPAEQLLSLPRVMTETGWATQGSGSITEDEQGRLYLTLYLSNFKRGWTYTFIYMIRDDPVQGYWGFIDTDYNPKTSGTYMHNFTTIVSQTNPHWNAPPVSYTLPNVSSTVHDLLLRTQNGYLLIVWNEQAIGTADVVVELSNPVAEIDVYDPTVGTTVQQALKQTKTATLTLNGYAVNVLALTS